MTSSPLRIAIVGGGPAGLTLGVLLHKRGIPFTIFELRPKPTDEELARPSGSLDLHEETGLAALHEAGLFDEFISLTGDCSEADVIAHKNGQIIYRDDGKHSNRPEITRHKLTNLLQSHLPASAIRWKHKLISAERSTPASGFAEVELDFGENGKQTFDLVVGADGAWSQVRNLLTDQKPEYADVQCITLNITQLTSKHPQLSEFVGSGTFLALGDGHGVMSQRSGDDATRIYLMLSADEDFATASGLAGKTPGQARDQVLGDNSLLGEWGAPFPELVTAAFENESAAGVTKLDIKPLYRLPVGHSWEHKSGATLVGDSAHLMCPWAGEGVNLAMCDSLELSRAIIKAHETAETGPPDAIQRALDPLVEKYETEMVEKSKETAQETLDNGKMMFGGTDGSVDMANWFRNMIAQSEP